MNFSKYYILACDNCNEWFHFECIGFKGNEKQAVNYRFTCCNCENLNHTAKFEKSDKYYEKKKNEINSKPEEAHKIKDERNKKLNLMSKLKLRSGKKIKKIKGFRIKNIIESESGEGTF